MCTNTYRVVGSSVFYSPLLSPWLKACPRQWRGVTLLLHGPPYCSVELLPPGLEVLSRPFLLGGASFNSVCLEASSPIDPEFSCTFYLSPYPRAPHLHAKLSNPRASWILQKNCPVEVYPACTEQTSVSASSPAKASEPQDWPSWVCLVKVEDMAEVHMSVRIRLQLLVPKQTASKLASLGIFSEKGFLDQTLHYSKIPRRSLLRAILDF